MQSDANNTNLIPLHTNDGAQAVMGRDLHAFLEVGRDYTNWMKQMIGYGFTEGTDFELIKEKIAGQPGSPNLANTRHNHIISLDMAKEISMIQRTEKGKQARQYFIECEKRAKEAPALTGPELMARALIEANATMKAIEADRDKVVAELEAYQLEAANALDAYFHKGGAINPRAEEHQLNALLRQSQMQMELCQAAKGLIHPDHLEAKARIVLARGLGEAPELDPATRPLYTADFSSPRTSPPSG